MTTPRISYTLLQAHYPECPQGWLGLLADILSLIEMRYAEAGITYTPAHFTLRNVQQKFGWMRVHYDSIINLDDIIDQAANRSASTCEHCGNAAHLWVHADNLHAWCPQHRHAHSQSPSEYRRTRQPRPNGLRKHA